MGSCAALVFRLHRWRSGFQEQSVPERSWSAEPVFFAGIGDAMRIAVGLIIAVAAAFVMTVPEIGGVATWKWVLAAIGLAVFVAGGRRK